MTQQVDLISVDNIDEVFRSTNMRLFKIGELRIVLAKLQDQFFAFDQACPHLGYPLNEGTLAHEKVICPWHDFKFDLKSGQEIHQSCSELTTYKVIIKKDKLVVEI